MRLIQFGDDGVVTLTGAFLDQGMSARDYTIQCVILTLLNLQTSNIAVPGWGGSLLELLKKPRRATLDETRLDVAESVIRAEATLIGLDGGDGQHVIDGVSLRDVQRDASGRLMLKLEISYEDAVPASFTYPVEQS